MALRGRGVAWGVTACQRWRKPPHNWHAVASARCCGSVGPDDSPAASAGCQVWIPLPVLERFLHDGAGLGVGRLTVAGGARGRTGRAWAHALWPTRQSPRRSQIGGRSASKSGSVLISSTFLCRAATGQLSVASGRCLSGRWCSRLLLAGGPSRFDLDEKSVNAAANLEHDVCRTPPRDFLHSCFDLGDALDRFAVHRLE